MKYPLIHKFAADFFEAEPFIEPFRLHLRSYELFFRPRHICATDKHSHCKITVALLAFILYNGDTPQKAVAVFKNDSSRCDGGLVFIDKKMHGVAVFAVKFKIFGGSLFENENLLAYVYNFFQLFVVFGEVDPFC